MKTEETETAGPGTSTSARRHGPAQARFLTDIVAEVEGAAVPDYIFELDKAIAAYVERANAREVVLDYEDIYSSLWDAVQTRNGTRSIIDALLSPVAGRFPSEEEAELLKSALSEVDLEKAKARFQGVLDSLWFEPEAITPNMEVVCPVSSQKKEESLGDVTSVEEAELQAGASSAPVRREAPVSADAPAPQDGSEAELGGLAPPSKPDELPIEVVVIDVPDHKATRVPIREADPVPSESRELETRGVPVERALIPVSEPVAPRAEGRGWGRRILGTLFNAAAGAGAGMAVRAGVLSLTGGSVVAALGAGAAFSGLVSVGRQHAENVRARRQEDPQAQGWALHREVFAQNRKSYLNRFLTSCAVFAGAGAVGYAYGDQIAAWVSDKIDSVAGLFHSAAGDAAPSAVPSVAPQTAVPAPAPVEAVVSPAPVEVPSLVETPPVVSQPPVTAVDVPATPEPASTPVVETPAPIMESPAAPVDSRTLALENARTLLQGEKFSSEVQDALRRAASENPRLGAQGLKDLAHHFSGTNSAFAYKLAEEALKVNPDNAQAALFAAHYQTHGLGGAPPDLSGAYEKAAQVQGSPHAGAAQRHEARDLLRYLTRTLGFRPA
jgi:hypothetical protein